MTDSTDPLDELRAEYEALAERNWNAIQDIHRAYDWFSRQAKRLLVLLFVVQILTGVGLGVVLMNASGLTRRVAHNQAASTMALCALRDDLQLRKASSQDFLDKHPRGIPGIPVATIQQSIDNENRTITALAPVPCPRAKHPKHPKHQ